MGLFDSLRRAAESSLKKEASKAVNEAVRSAEKNANHTESFTFESLPTCVAELQALPEANL